METIQNLGNNYFECGKASANNKFKIYFDTAKDLVEQLKALKEFGFDVPTE